MGKITYERAAEMLEEHAEFGERHFYRQSDGCREYVDALYLGAKVLKERAKEKKREWRMN
jgi:hypothetical protein